MYPFIYKLTKDKLSQNRYTHYLFKPILLSILYVYRNLNIIEIDSLIPYV